MRSLIAAGLAALATAPLATAQTTWFVDCNTCPDVGSGTALDPFCSLQDAVTLAVSGDTVLVRPCVYNENVGWVDKAITVRSDADGDPNTIDPDPVNTILDGGLANTVVSMVNDQGSVLEGFTIRRGGPPAGTSAAGGIYVSGSPTIRGNRIILNVGFAGGIFCDRGSAPHIDQNIIVANFANSQVATTLGGGIQCIDADPLIENNVISNNRAVGTFGLGGGVYSSHQVPTPGPFLRNNVIGENVAADGGGIWSQGSITIEDCVIENNVAGTLGAGGGMLLEAFGADVRLSRNRVQGNTAGNGGGIRFNGTATLLSNLIVGNTATVAGGGIELLGGAPILANTTIVANVALQGGGIWNQSDAQLLSSILRDNNAPAGPQIYVENNFSFSANFSNVQGGEADVFVGSGATINFGAGMIDADPQFVDPLAGDFRLLAGSPCIDTGDPAFSFCCDRDLEQEPRLIDGLLDGDQRVDMGSSERINVRLTVTGDATPGGTLEFAVDGPAGLPSLLALASESSDLCLPPFGCLGFPVSALLTTIPLGETPASLSFKLPGTFPTPGLLVAQALSVAGASVGNLTNPVVLEVE